MSGSCGVWKAKHARWACLQMSSTDHHGHMSHIKIKRVVVAWSGVCVSLPMVQSARTWSRLVRADSRGVRGNSNIQRTNARSRPNTPSWLSPMASKSPVWTVSLDTCVSCSETNPSGPLALSSKGRQITGRHRSWISGQGPPSKAGCGVVQATKWPRFVVETQESCQEEKTRPCWIPASR